MTVLVNRIALGTVQFGLPYGISNRSGQVDRSAASMIVDYCRSRGMDTIDTAIAYGESERRLGEIGVADWHVITKVSAVPDGCRDVAAWVRESIEGSLARLQLRKLRGVLLHHPQVLLGPDGEQLYRALTSLKDEGTVEKIGVSIYAPTDLEELVPRFTLDLVQAPFNVIDRRLATSGWLTRLSDLGTEIHVRSLFLQGLLLMDEAARPERFAPWQPLWTAWRQWLTEHNLSPLEGCLHFALAQPEVSRLVVGADSLTQMQQIIASVVSRSSTPAAPSSLQREDLDLINPLNWIGK